MNQFRRGLAVLSLAALVVTQLSAAPVIGVATTRGVMEVDNATVRGTADLSEGSSVRMGEMAGQVQLSNGVHATLAKAASAKVHANRIELSAGAGQVSTKTGFDFVALGFRISPDVRSAVARVTYERADRILVTPVDSPVRVSRNGVMLARLTPGTTYYFEPGTGNQQDPDNTPQSAGKRRGGGKIGTVSQHALSNGAKWGIALGAAAAAAGVGIGIAMSMDEGTPVSSR